MSLDRELLDRHRGFDDPEAGISETFVSAELGSVPTVAILYRPLGPSRPQGWVVCHSFGMEQTFLMEHEVAAARALAKAGFPTLRYHGQGYGDSQGDPHRVGLESHLADALDAVSVLRTEAGVERVGTLGARFGGTVAALVADREALPLLAAWEPVTRGLPYMRELLRSHDLFQMLQGPHGMDAASAPDPLERLTSQGWTDVKGLYLTEEAYRTIAQVDLRRDLRRFRGSCLLVGVSRTGVPGRGIHAVAERLRSLGAGCQEEGVADEEAGNLGGYHYDNDEDPNAKRDVQAALASKLADATVGWALRIASEAKEEGEAAR
jgi:pimeloyl-ACP methyl ester carboxylesterase